MTSSWCMSWSVVTYITESHVPCYSLMCRSYHRTHSEQFWVMKKYRKISTISRAKSPKWCVSGLVLQLSFPIHWSQVLSREWICNWSSADRRCSNYIWVTKIYLPTRVRLIFDFWRYITYSITWNAAVQSSSCPSGCILKKGHGA